MAGDVFGIYPLLPDDTFYFLAVDFDEAEWRDDTRVFVQSCQELKLPVAALEFSRSGNALGSLLVPETTFNKVKKPQYDTNYGSSATFIVPMFHVEP